MLFTASLLVSVPIRDAASVEFNMLIVIPLTAVGLFFLLVPVQLRADRSTVAYRNWIRWRTGPLEEVDSVRMFLIGLGVARISGQKKRLIFFLEPPNRYLLGNPLRDPGVGSRSPQNELPSIVSRQWQAILDVAVGALGGGVAFATSMVMPSQLSSPLVSPPNIPSWLAAVLNFEDHHQAILLVGTIVALVIATERKRSKGPERVIAYFMIGMAAVILLIKWKASSL